MAAGTARARKREQKREAPPVSRRAYVLLVSSASLFAVLVACHRYGTVMLEAGGRFEDPDAMFHARRVVRTIAERKLLPPVFDPYENYPEGGRALWPPLHDAALALLARLGGSTAADPRRGLPVAAALPVAEVALALLAAAALAKRAAGRRGGAAAAWLFALTPCIPVRGAFGEIDHNLTEVLLALLLVLLAESLAPREQTTGGGLRGLLSAILWAAAVLIALGFYSGLVLSAGIVAAAVAVRDLTAPERRSLPRLCLGFGVAALALPWFASLRVRPDPDDPWRLGPSYVLALGILAVVTGLFALAQSARRGFSKDSDLLSATGVGAGAVALAATSTRAWLALARGAGFLASRDPWLATINEFRPVFKNLRWAGTALPAVPVGVIAVALFLWPRRRTRVEIAPGLVIIGVPFALFALLALFQSRSLPLAVAFGAAVGGAAFGLLVARPVARAMLWGVAAFCLFPTAFEYLIPFLGATLTGSSAPAVLPYEIAAKAIASHTPEPGDPPAWGVFSWWDFGHPILFQANRPVAVDNFGGMQPGFESAQRLWLEPSPAKVVRELDRRRLRFVQVIWPPYFVPAAAVSLGLDPIGYFEEKWSLDHVPAYRPTPLGERAFATRLHLSDAAPLPADGPEDRAALSRFRRIWSSDETSPGPQGPLPVQKLFELLPEPTSPEARAHVSR